MAEIVVSVLDDELRERHAEIIGEQLHRAIVCPEVVAINETTVSERYGDQKAVNRWITALNFCADPVRAEMDSAHLNRKEIPSIRRASARLAIVNTVVGNALDDEKLGSALKSSSSFDLREFRDESSAQIFDLLTNGVLDSLRWIKLLRSKGMKYDEILKHPIFPIATTLTMESHGALSGIMSVAKGDIPETRPQVVQILELLGKEVIAGTSIMQGVSTDLRPVSARGFCPAARMRDEKGNTWLSVLVKQAVDLQRALTPKVEFRLP